MLSLSRTAAWLAIAMAALSLAVIPPTSAQENAQSQIPPSLVECYNTSYFMNRDNRLPSNIETLISLIEKVENSPGFNQDIRTLVVSLIQRFRQDGIQRAQNVAASPGVIPYSPVGYRFSKFRILISRLIPNNYMAYQFPNSSLSLQERCSLHFMLSSSIDTRVRGDENNVCNRLSQYRSERIPRALDWSKQQNQNQNQKFGDNFIGDVELIDAMKVRSASGRIYQPMRPKLNPGAQNFDTDFGWADVDYNSGSNNMNNDISLCPVENGVIWTPWGTISAGTMLAGIATGLQQQTVQLRTLLALSKHPGNTNLRQTTTISIDNRWAATLAGDLAQVALVQVPVSPTNTASVGASGAWNSTVMPKWYFLSQRNNLEMTDAEIRGGLDGLILAMNVAQWRTQASSMKLSQLLRMYYSMQGVLGSGIMACNRKDQFQNVASIQTMIAQTAGFAQVLDREMQLHVTLSPDAIAEFSTYAANALYNYVPQYLNDVSCSVSSALPQDISASIVPMTNIYVFLDTSWQYNNVVDYVNYVLQNLNINPYASSVTLLSASDCAIMVNTTNYLTDVNEKWNVTTHSMYVTGFNLPTVLRTVQNLTMAYMNAEKTNNSVGGRSLVALLMPYMGTVTDGDSAYAINQLQTIREQVPDLHFIYYTGGTVNRFASFVKDPSTDIFALNTGSSVASSSGPVVVRIKKIPRRIINPRCGASWSTNSWGTDQVAQYVRPGFINFYRIVPNYFFGGGSGRYVNIQSQYSMQFTVCSSRTALLPSSNNGTGSTSTNSDGSSTSTQSNCIQINNGNGFSYDLSNACSGYSTIHQCPPLYISVQAPASTANGQTQQTVSCSDAACQTPDASRYTVSVVNLGCYSGVANLVASFAMVIAAFFLHQLLH